MDGFAGPVCTDFLYFAAIFLHITDRVYGNLQAGSTAHIHTKAPFKVVIVAALVGRGPVSPHGQSLQPSRYASMLCHLARILARRTLGALQRLAKPCLFFIQVAPPQSYQLVSILRTCPYTHLGLCANCTVENCSSALSRVLLRSRLLPCTHAFL